MCGMFQTSTLIMAKNFIPQLRYPKANCHHINCTDHKKQTICLSLKSTAASDMNDSCQIFTINHLEKLSSFKDTIINHRLNLLDRDDNVKPWIANELAFYDTILIYIL